MEPCPPGGHCELRGCQAWLALAARPARGTCSLMSPRLFQTLRERADVFCVTALAGWKRTRCITTVKTNFWERGTPLARDPSTRGREPLSTHSCCACGVCSAVLLLPCPCGCPTSVTPGFPFLGCRRAEGEEKWSGWKSILGKDAQEGCWDPGWRKGWGSTSPLRSPCFSSSQCTSGTVVPRASSACPAPVDVLGIRVLFAVAVLAVRCCESFPTLCQEDFGEKLQTSVQVKPRDQPDAFGSSSAKGRSIFGGNSQLVWVQWWQKAHEDGFSYTRLFWGAHFS